MSTPSKKKMFTHFIIFKEAFMFLKISFNIHNDQIRFSKLARTSKKILLINPKDFKVVCCIDLLLIL